VHLAPQSRGTVEIRNGDFRVAPAIRFNFLERGQDLRIMVQGLKMLRRIAEQTPLKNFIEEEMSPSPKVQTDVELGDFVRKNGSSNLHAVGTCRMGRDALAVTDERLKVYGVERLRVVDVSVIPKITTGNTHGPAVMIAEKAAAMIVEDAKFG
jgi:choline dehydrogenase